MADHASPARRPSRIARLCLACIERAAVDGGGVAVLSSRRSPVLVHASDPVARALSELQFTLGEGPSVDAVASGAPVLVADIDQRRGRSERWPALLPELTALDVRALFAFPIQVGEVALGTLDLYRCAPGPLSPAQVEVSRTVGGLIGDSLVSEDPPSEADARYPMSVHRAAGMVMVQLGTSIEDALVRLRATAFEEGRPVTAVAAEVLGGRRTFSEED